MTNEQLIYTKVEFTLDVSEHDSVRFREAVRKLLRDFEGYLIGFQAEDLISGNILCDDAGFAEADFVLKSVFPDHVANHLLTVTDPGVIVCIGIRRRKRK